MDHRLLSTKASAAATSTTTTTSAGADLSTCLAAAMSSIREARYEESIQLFRTALECLRAHIHHHHHHHHHHHEPSPNQNDDDDEHENGDQPQLILGTISLRETAPGMVKSSFDDTVHKDNHNSLGAFAMFDKAFYITNGSSPNQEIADDDDGEDAALWLGDNVHRSSAVLLYNTALMYHVQGCLLVLQSSRHPDAFLPADRPPPQSQQFYYDKALKLYDMALQVLHNCRERQAMELLLSLAIFNNKGHIYCQCWELAQANECVFWIQQVLDCCRHPHHHNSHCENISDGHQHELEHFRWNVLLWNYRQECCSAVAPAA